MFFAVGTAVSLTTMRSAPASALGEDTTLITEGVAFAVSTLVSGLGATTAAECLGLTAVSTTDTPVAALGSALSVKSARFIRTGVAFEVSTLVCALATGAAALFAVEIAVSLTTMRAALVSTAGATGAAPITTGVTMAVSTLISSFGSEVATTGATTGITGAFFSVTDTAPTLAGSLLRTG